MKADLSMSVSKMTKRMRMSREVMQAKKSKGLLKIFHDVESTKNKMLKADRSADRSLFTS